MNQFIKHIILELEKTKNTILLIFLLLITTQYSYPQTDYIAGSPKLAVWELGNSKEITIILHGGPSVEHSYLRPEWDTLSSISKIYYYDQRGCGKSDTAQSYTWIDHVQDLKRIKEAISKNEKIILAGSSWGAELALLYSIYFPQDLKALILSGFCRWHGTNSKKVDFNAYIIDSVYSFIRKEHISYYEDSIKASKKIDSKKLIEKFIQTGDSEKELKSRIKANYAITEATLKSLKSCPDISYLSNVNIPILIFGANSDNLFCSNQDWSDVLEDLNSKTQRIEIENACHDPWFTHPNEFFQECLKFMRNLNE